MLSRTTGGLAEIRFDSAASEVSGSAAPTILHLFSSAENARLAGLSDWDTAFLRALYHTDHTDQHQLQDIDTAMVQAIAGGQSFAR